MKAPYTRVRTRGGFLPAYVTSVVVDYVPNPDVTYPPVITYVGGVGEFERMTDVVTPGFSRTASQGLIVNTAMDALKEIYERSSSTVDYFQTHPLPGGQARNTITGACGDHFSLDLSPFSLETNIAEELIDENFVVYKAAVEARSRISPAKLMSLVSLAELHKTVGLIASSAKTLAKVISAVKRGSPKEAVESIVGRKFKNGSVRKDISDNVFRRWLEYRYGWLPLVYEVQGAIEAIAARNDYPLRTVSRGHESVTASKTYTRVYDGGSVGKWTIRYELEQTVTVRVYILYEADFESHNARNFGLYDFPQSLWELMPYSFVVDWFISVGDWLEAISPKVGVKVKAEGYTVTNDITCKRTPILWTKQTVGGLSFDMTGSFLNTSDSYRRIHRFRHPSLDGILLYPRFDTKLNLKRALDSIALLNAKFGSRRL